MQITEYIHNGCIIVVHRPELSEEERNKRESNVERALNCFCRVKQDEEYQH